MQAINVTNVPTQLAPAGNRDFIHIYNNSDVTIYLDYDGADPTTLTTANGMPVLPTAMYTLDNVGPRNIYTKAVWAIHGAGAVNKEVRVHGV